MNATTRARDEIQVIRQVLFIYGFPGKKNCTLFNFDDFFFFSFILNSFSFKLDAVIYAWILKPSQVYEFCASFKLFSVGMKIWYYNGTLNHILGICYSRTCSNSFSLRRTIPWVSANRAYKLAEVFISNWKFSSFLVNSTVNINCLKLHRNCFT